MKKFVSTLLRKLGLSGFADKLRYHVVRLQNRGANNRFAAEHPRFIFPPDYFIYETYALEYRGYYSDGLEAAQTIIKETKHFIKYEEGKKSILDWGCGPGKVIRWLPEIAGSRNNFLGCDYNPKYIKWNKTHFPDISFFENTIGPPLHLPATSIDLVYALSVLTHLSAENHYLWLAEIHRILKPGGIFLFTTQGNACSYKLTDAERENYDRGNLVVRHFSKEGHRLFSAFHPPGYIYVLVADFKVLSFIEGKQNGPLGIQDCWVIQKNQII